MTILTAAQAAIARLVGRRPTAVVSSQGEMEVEMTALAQEAAVDIMKGHDWQALTEFYEVDMDGVTTSYPFPGDYDRMVQASEVFDPNNWCWGYHHIPDSTEWLLYEIRRFPLLVPGVWTIRKNQFHFMPTPAQGEKAIFPYISKNIFRTVNGSPKTEITRDDDSFVLDERLLTLSLIWRWLQLKRMDYAEDMRLYEDAFSQEQTRDRGGRAIRQPSLPRYGNRRVAWPWPMGPGIV